MSAPDHVIPFRLPAWLGWTVAFVLLIATGYFAISNFNARSQVDALRAQAQAADIEAKSLKNLLTAEQLISARQIDALKAALAEVARLQTGNKVDASPPKVHYASTLKLIASGPVTSVTVSDFPASTVVYFHGSLKTNQTVSVSIPRSSENISVETDEPQNLTVKNIWDDRETDTYHFGDTPGHFPHGIVFPVRSIQEP